MRHVLPQALTNIPGGGITMRTWLMLAPAALLAAVLSAPATRAADETNAQKIEQLQKDLADLKSQMEDLRKEVRDSSVRGMGMSNALRDLQQRVDLMQQLLAQQNELLRMQARQAFSYTPPANGAAPPAGVPVPVTPPRSVIRLENRYVVPATVYINGQAYPVPPYQTVEVRDVPVGTFTYEVSAEGYGMIRRATTRTLTADRPFRITIDPPAMPAVVALP
jgi:hypothetical protein